MNKKQQHYTSADAWREAAISRIVECSKQESDLRQQQADHHNEQSGTSDADTLQDQQLYILGKMDIEEYQDYLLFKHTKA